MTRYGWLGLAVLGLILVLLGACARPEIVTAVDTICVSTSRYHATEAQIAAFKADQTLWQSLVDWMTSFNTVRDGECLKPVAGP